jgi:hypothetical protein
MMFGYPESIARCQHLKINGTQCGSPALHRNRFCFFHKKWRDQTVRVNARARKNAILELPVLEDANSIQVALMQVMRLLASGQLDHKTASLLLYGLQTASFNLRHTSFEPIMKQTVIINPKNVDQAVLGEDLWEKEDFEEEVDEEQEDGSVEIQAVADTSPLPHPPAPLPPSHPACSIDFSGGNHGHRHAYRPYDHGRHQPAKDFQELH